MNWYTVALFAHIVGVLLLFITLAAQWFITLRLHNAPSLDQVRDSVKLAKQVGKLAPVSAVLILGDGIYMTAASWSMLTTWIDVSLAAMVLMSVMSMGVMSRRFAAIGRAVNQVSAEVTPDRLPTAMRVRLDDPAMWISAQTTLAVALSIVFMMTTKPNLAVSIISVFVALALGVFLGMLTFRPPRAQGETPRPALHIPAKQQSAR